MAKAGLVVALLVAAWLRVAGLGWGIPRYDAALVAGTELRTSWHPDEDRTLWALLRLHSGALDVGVGDARWGSLTTYLVGGALRVAEVVGAFSGGWPAAFAEARPALFGRVFATGRLVVVVFAVGTVGVTWRFARDCGTAVAAFVAALLVAVSPLHVVHSHFLAPDVPLAFWVLLGVAFWATGHGVMAGLAFGFALATKPSAVFMLPLLAVPLPGTKAGRTGPAFVAAAVAFVIGQPAAFLDPHRFAEEIGRLWAGNGIGAGPLGFFDVAVRQLAQIGVYGLGPVGLGLSLLGLRRETIRLATPAALLVGSSFLSWIPMGRYTLPALPVLAVAAGLGAASLEPRLRWALVGLAVLPPLAMSIAQVQIMAGAHPAQRAGDWVRDHVAEGVEVAQVWREYPLLDGHRHRLSRLDDPANLMGHPWCEPTAGVIALDDMGLTAWRPELEATLERRYVLQGVFEARPSFAGLNLPEPWAALDWKYSHPRIAIWARR